MFVFPIKHFSEVNSIWAIVSDDGKVLRPFNVCTCHFNMISTFQRNDGFSCLNIKEAYSHEKMKFFNLTLVDKTRNKKSWPKKQSSEQGNQITQKFIIDFSNKVNIEIQRFETSSSKSIYERSVHELVASIPIILRILSNYSVAVLKLGWSTAKAFTWISDAWTYCRICSNLLGKQRYDLYKSYAY